MSIIRVRKDANYFSASNEPFNDVRLSWEARGLMGYLLSKTDGWEIRFEDLKNQGPAKEHKIRRMLSELRMNGYLNRIRISMSDGTFDWTSEVYESPSQNPKKQTSMRFSTSGSSTRGKSTDILSTEDDLALSRISKSYESEIGLITSSIADELQDAAKTYPLQWVLDAIHEAAIQNKRSWKYILAILKRWHAQGNQDSVKKTQPQEQTPVYAPTPERIKTPRPANVPAPKIAGIS